MPEFNIRSDSVNVEQIMEQIRARIREKRGVDYTEEQIRALATVKLEKFFDPRGVRSDLFEQFKRREPRKAPLLPKYAFEEETLYESHRASVRWIRRLLNPILKLFFNPNPLIQVLHIQADLNALNVELEAQREIARHDLEQMMYEVVHNLVVEMTRMGIEVKNLRMRIESLTGRLEFNERRARALESTVVYKPQERQSPGPATPAETYVAVPPTGPAVGPPAPPNVEGPGQRSRRRRRRRGRRGGAPATAVMGGQSNLTPPSAQIEAPEQPGREESRQEQDEAAAVHAETAESIEQALASESHPSELPGPEPGHGTGSGGTGEQ